MSGSFDAEPFVIAIDGYSVSSLVRSILRAGECVS